jgi:hypothetical protein
MLANASVLIEPPTRTPLLIESDEPMVMNEQALNAVFARMHPARDTLEPIRAEARIDIELPAWKKSKTETSAPNLAKLLTDKLLPYEV